MSEQEFFINKIVKYFNEPENVTLKNEIEEEANQSAEKKQLFDQINSIWQASADLKLLEELDVRVAVSDLLQRLNVDADKHVTQVSWFTPILKRWTAAAAVLLLAVAGIWFYIQFNTVNYQLKVTQNAIDSVKLTDGTKIYLDKHSSLKYPTSLKGPLRQVYLLKGQAFFKVFHNAAQPFVVGINKASVTVLGTSFNINLINSQVELSVHTGRVKFDPNTGDGNIWILSAGSAITYNQANSTYKTFAASNNSNAWLTNKLDFVDASLADVCKQLEVFYKVKIRIDGNISAFKKLNAVFKENNLNEVLEVLQETYPIKIEKEADNTINIKSLYKARTTHYLK